jgi:transcriptional regulator with XRE-family HTH domain
MDSDDRLLKLFGQRVRTLRKEKGFSQEAFADFCGLDRSYVGGIERGERNISLKKIEIIAKSLDVKISELMIGL